jgi:hypothetical protein
MPQFWTEPVKKLTCLPKINTCVGNVCHWLAEWESTVASRVIVSEFEVARLDRTARLAGESFAYDEGHGPHATDADAGYRVGWWLAGTVGLFGLYWLGAI